MTITELPDVLELGKERSLRFFVNDAGDRIGAFETHPSCDAAQLGEPCTGAVYFNVPGAPENRPHWNIDAFDPLTLSPSIRCSCGNHGFIRQGKWVPA